MVYRHSGYPGGIKRQTYAELLDRKPEEAVRTAIRGMLPKNRLGRPDAQEAEGLRRPDPPARRPAARSRSTSPTPRRAERIGDHRCPSRSPRPPVAASRPSPASASAPGTGQDHRQQARRRGLLPVRHAPDDPHRAAAAHRDRRALRHRRHDGRRRRRPARPAPCASASPGRSSSSTPSCGPPSRRPASSPATPARRSRRSTASRRPARLRSTPSARSPRSSP